MDTPALVVDIDQLPAGPAMNKLMAEHVLKLRVIETEDGVFISDGRFLFAEMPNYSGDTEIALEFTKRFLEGKTRLEFTGAGYAMFVERADGRPFAARGQTIAEAICRVVYKAEVVP